MNEKDLIVSLAKTEKEVDELLISLSEGTKGNLQFKKMKLRRLMKKDVAHSFIPALMEFMRKHTTYSEIYGNLSLPNLIRDLNNETATDFQMYLIIKCAHPAFVEENYPTIVENVTEGRNAFYGITGFDNDRDIELFYHESIEEINRGTNEKTLLDKKEWFIDNIGPIDVHIKTVQSMDLVDFDRLVNTSITPEELHFSKHYFKTSEKYSRETLSYILDDETYDRYYESEFKKVGEVLDTTAVKVALYFAFTEVGAYNSGLRANLLEMLSRQFSDFKAQYLEEKINLDNKFMYELVKKIQNDHESEHTLRTQNEEKHQKSISKITKKFESTKTENENLKGELSRTNFELNEAKDILAMHKAKSIGYTKGLTSTYFSLKYLLIHYSDLHFAPEIFPEIKFITAEELDFVDSEFETILIQQLGGSIREKRDIEKKAINENKTVVWLTSLDERELIFEVGQVLKSGGGNK